jgi:hypothetical protein
MLGFVEENSEEESRLGSSFDVTPLAANAAMNHEFLIAYVNQGFTRAEAMQILMLVIWTGLMRGY